MALQWCSEPQHRHILRPIQCKQTTSQFSTAAFMSALCWASVNKQLKSPHISENYTKGKAISQISHWRIDNNTNTLQESVYLQIVEPYPPSKFSGHHPAAEVGERKIQDSSCQRCTRNSNVKTISFGCVVQEKG